MLEAESFIAKNDLQKGLELCQKALQADPKLFSAALTIVDIYFRLSDFARAETAAANAVSIDPNAETGYRFWGRVLEELGKKAEARDKYIEAYILAPYDPKTNSSLIFWSNQNNVKIAHPPIKIPTDVTTGADGNTNITLDFSVLMGGKDKKNDNGSSAWMFYGLTRVSWSAGKDGKLSESFTKAYPNETKYRHSLAEEKDALQTVLTMLEADQKKKKSKQLDSSLAMLKKLNDEGYLDAYILLAKADEGIKKDYPAYLAANRDKLRQYVINYVMAGGGVS
jgi:tetratricopeptide (TPR) repeat protein